MAKTRKKPDRRPEISRMIQALRAEGMTQATIAESLGVSGATVSLLKSQKYPANVDRYHTSLKKLMDDVGIAELSTSPARMQAQSDNSYGEWVAEKLEETKLTPAELAQKAGISTLTVNYILNGTTSDPQAGTKKKIETALAGVSGKPISRSRPKKNAKSNVFSGIPFVEEELNQVPDDKGVYAIHDRRGYPTYIGKGDVRSRLRKHMKEHRAFVDERVAYTFSYVILQDGTSADARKKADKEAGWLENILAKFAGNTVLLNKRLVTDLSDGE